MKVKFELDELVVPLVIEKVFRKAKEVGLKSKDKNEREFWEQFDGTQAGDEECFKVWWLARVDGKGFSHQRKGLWIRR